MKSEENDYCLFEHAEISNDNVDATVSEVNITKLEGNSEETQPVDENYSESVKDVKDTHILVGIKRSDSRLRYQCDFCNKLYSRRQTLEDHILQKHRSKQDLPFQCKVCPKKFVSEKRKIQHEFIHLPAEKKFIHPCPYCDKK